MCLKHLQEEIWNWYCSYCPQCFIEDKSFRKFIKEFIKKNKRVRM